MSLQTKLSDNMKCGKSQGQVNYCYSQILLKPIITFIILMLKNLYPKKCITEVLIVEISFVTSFDQMTTKQPYDIYMHIIQFNLSI